MTASTIACAGIFSSVREKSVAFQTAPLSGIVPDGVMIWSPAMEMSPRDSPTAGYPPGGPAGMGAGIGAGRPAPAIVGW
ncbi:hypothetical protein DRB96_02220 [Streptomyces sp. ICC1]|nr:hypothetical protein DRB96_02220 [Streptomyces sp. ICC1]